MKGELTVRNYLMANKFTEAQSKEVDVISVREEEILEMCILMPFRKLSFSYSPVDDG